MDMVIVGTDRDRKYFARPGGAGWTVDITEAAIVASEADPLYVTLRAARPLHLERVELMDRASFVDADGPTTSRTSKLEPVFSGTTLDVWREDGALRWDLTSSDKRAAIAELAAAVEEAWKATYWARFCRGQLEGLPPVWPCEVRYPTGQGWAYGPVDRVVEALGDDLRLVVDDIPHLWSAVEVTAWQESRPT